MPCHALRLTIALTGTLTADVGAQNTPTNWGAMMTQYSPSHSPPVSQAIWNHGICAMSPAFTNPKLSNGTLLGTEASSGAPNAHSAENGTDQQGGARASGWMQHMKAFVAKWIQRTEAFGAKWLPVIVCNFFFFVFLTGLTFIVLPAVLWAKRAVMKAWYCSVLHPQMPPCDPTVLGPPPAKKALKKLLEQETERFARVFETAPTLPRPLPNGYECSPLFPPPPAAHNTVPLISIAQVQAHHDEGDAYRCRARRSTRKARDDRALTRA